MKILFVAALACLASLSLHAQKVIEKTLPYRDQQRVNLDLKFANTIQVQGWDKPEVYVKITVTINNGRLNDALLVNSGSQADEISVKVDFDKELVKQGKKEDCPDRNGSNTSWSDGESRYYLCSDIFYEVYLPRQANLHLETINGNVEIKELSGPVFAKSISGFVDVSWPKNKGADLAMKSVTGELYADPDISFQNKENKPTPIGYLLKGTVNGGGPKVQLESISNNVYVRRR